MPAGRDAGWDSMVQPRARMTHLKRSGIGVPGPYAAYYLTRNRYFFARDCLGIDPELAMDQQERTWERKTRARVSERAPHWLPVFEELVDQAKRDARAGRDGEARGHRAATQRGRRPRRRTARRGISVTDDLAFFPDRRHSNPYQTMLYGDLGRVGAAPRPVRSLREHLAKATASARPGVLHVHWTTPVLGAVRNAARARAKVARIGDLLDAFQEAGGRLVWTVHDVVPHDSVHVESEVALARLLADRADLVHVMSDATLPAAAPYVEIDPARTVCIPHASYRGVYPDWVSRAGARRRLGVAPAESVVLALGRIRPGEGLDRLLDFAGRPGRPHLRLLVAGALRRRPESEELAARLSTAPRTTSLTRRLRDDEIQVWMRAADIAVLPSSRGLSSGALLLAESFDLPVVAPRTGALVEREADPHVRLFDEDDFEGVLSDAVSDLVADRDGAAVARESAERAARSRPVGEMAARFADAVAPLMSFTQS